MSATSTHTARDCVTHYAESLGRILRDAGCNELGRAFLELAQVIPLLTPARIREILSSEVPS